MKWLFTPRALLAPYHSWTTAVEEGRKIILFAGQLALNKQ